MKFKISAILFLSVTMAILLFTTSCAHDDGSDSTDTKPWSRPAAWDGTVLGVPM